MADDAAFHIRNSGSDLAVLVICDHATRHVPQDISANGLGLELTDLERHIAYDVGALEVARIMADALGATLVSSNFSRLLADANRGEDDPTLIMRLYDGTIIPGNRQLTATDRAMRLARFWRPYRGALEREIAIRQSRGQVPVLVSVHSFTPQLRGGAPRPWHVGVLWHRDDRMARPFIAALARLEGVVIGDNEPYAGGLPGDTLEALALSRGLPHILIEFRNDLIADAAGQAEWAARVMPALRTALAAVA
jgi:predicted N-formylglutamate amidohydrolase